MHANFNCLRASKNPKITWQNPQILSRSPNPKIMGKIPRSGDSGIGGGGSSLSRSKWEVTYVKTARPSTNATEKKSCLASTLSVFSNKRPLFVSGRQTMTAVSWSNPLRSGDSAKYPLPRKRGYFTEISATNNSFTKLLAISVNI